MQERYFSFSSYLKKVFGEKVLRIPVDAGFSCPTRDGTKGTRGCIYCYKGSNYFNERIPLKVQIEKGIERGKRKGVNKFLLYFQSYSNTYAPPEVLERTYSVAREFEEIVGIIVGTRPDCVSDDALKILEDFANDYLVWIEYGLQSVHFKSLRWINRGHGVSDFVDAVLRTRKRKGIKICAHVILGLPTEDEKDCLETADFLSAIRIDGVKIHPLHVIKDTQLYEIYKERPFKLLSVEEYANLVVKFLERLRKEIVIQRLTGEAPDELLVAPQWCSFREKHKVLNLIRKTLEEKDSYQGKFCRF